MNEKSEIAQRIFCFFVSQYSLMPDKADLAFVFGRNDLTLAIRTYSLWKRGLVENVLVTGGVGKDSGDLPMAEADFLAAHLYGAGIPGNRIIIERTATNGAENTKLGMQKVLQAGVPYRKVILVGHAANLLRLFATHTLLCREMGIEQVEYQLHYCPFQFKEEESDIFISEYRRLLEWPKKQWADQLALPSELTRLVESIK
jgi:hypothetical protein